MKQYLEFKGGIISKKMSIQELFSTGVPAAMISRFGVLAALILIIIVIWTLVWKGLALWKAARKNHLIWFVVLLIINTLGILEILYIFIFSKMGKNSRRK